MALTIYPTTDYDSFVSLTDANAIIESNSVHNDTWNTLTDTQKEVYLRIATDRIFDVISTDEDSEYGYLDETSYVYIDSCLPKVCSLMAIEDIVFNISAGINENTGLVSKEKAGDLEVEYFHGYPAKKVSSLNKNPYPKSIRRCLNAYGANLQIGLKQLKIERS